MYMVKTVCRGVVALSILVALAAPSYADVSVWIRFGNGMIVACPRPVADTYIYQGGCTPVYGLPAEYVSEPYSYYHGYPAYYPAPYWAQHRRHWRGEGDWYRHDRGWHRGWDHDRGWERHRDWDRHDHDHGRHRDWDRD